MRMTTADREDIRPDGSYTTSSGSHYEGVIHGFRSTEDGDAWTFWFLLDRSKISRTETRKILRGLLHSRQPFFRGAGRQFRGCLRFRRVGRRILCKQYGGWDT
jgi:hypothetical protein